MIRSGGKPKSPPKGFAPSEALSEAVLVLGVMGRGSSHLQFPSIRIDSLELQNRINAFNCCGVIISGG